MAWKAYLESVTDSPVPTDSFYWTVKFEDAATSRVIHKQYKIQAGQTGADAKQIALRDKQLLIEQDTLMAQFQGQVGNEIDTVAIVAIVMGSLLTLLILAAAFTNLW